MDFFRLKFLSFTPLTAITNAVKKTNFHILWKTNTPVHILIPTKYFVNFKIIFCFVLLLCTLWFMKKNSTLQVQVFGGYSVDP